jgi:hypothetical protein
MRVKLVANALIFRSVFVATKSAFSKPLASNGLFRHNKYMCATKYLCHFDTDLRIVSKNNSIILNFTLLRRNLSVQSVNFVVPCSDSLKFL